MVTDLARRNQARVVGKLGVEHVWVSADIAKKRNYIKKNFLATRYHSLVIDPKTLPSDFIVTAETKNKIIMGIAHTILPIYGFQFHPESIGTDIGKALLTNFLKLINYGN